MIRRALIVAALALVIGTLILKQAFVDAYASRDPAKAAAWWPGHPAVIFATGFGEVGRRAAAGQSVDKALVAPLLAAAAKVPLAPEPYLVRGVEARLAGNETIAARAFLEARHRAPRSVAARYFLADHYLRTGQTRQGLAEISALTRLVPQSLDEIAPYLAAYARSPGGAAQVKAMLRDHPELEPWLLNALAADPRSNMLIMYLWGGRGGEGARDWQVRLLNSLAAAGRFDEAQAAWNRFSPASTRVGELIDANFEGKALPPFGWTLVSGPAGVAEAVGSGRLHILYYGRDNLVLASQLLMLTPGAHRLSMRIEGASPSAHSLAWTMTCLPSMQEVGAVSLERATTGGALAAGFSIPSTGCAAQRLELVGTSPEIPEQAEVTISGLHLDREAGR